MNDIPRLWEVHRDASWPQSSGTDEGALMTLDNVISGCVVYFLESEEGLDPQRVEMLETCLEELTGFLPEIPDEAIPYFERLKRLAGLLLETNPRT